jgi:hypothetical protein
LKPIWLYVIGTAVIGLYVEYNKDSSFQSIDIGSILIGTSLGGVIGHYIA